MSMMRVRTTINGAQGLPGVMTFYFNGSTTTPSAPDAVDVCARVRAFCNSINTVWPSTITTQVQGAVDLLDAATGSLVGSLAVTPPAAVAGTSPSPLPAATALLLRHETGVIVAGRRMAGRSFISPCSTAIMAGGLPSSAILASASTAANVMRTGTTTSAPVVWHRPGGSGGGVGFATLTSNFSIGLQFAVLRSRRD
jgi:hypothetical protein